MPAGGGGGGGLAPLFFFAFSSAFSFVFFRLGFLCLGVGGFEGFGTFAPCCEEVEVSGFVEEKGEKAREYESRSLRTISTLHTVDC